MPSQLQDADGPVRHAVTLSAAWDAQPERGRDFALRLAPEVRVEAPGISVTAVGYGGFVPTVSSPMEPGMVGAILEAAWRPHRHLELGLRVARTAVLDPLREDAIDHATSCLPDDRADLGSWNAQYGDVGRVTARQEVGLGLAVPIFGRSLVWHSDVSWLRTERLDGARDDLRVRSQLQLAL